MSKQATSEDLDLFIDQVDQLMGTRLIRSGQLNASFKIHGETNQPVRFVQSVPDEDDFRSFLLGFRKFVLKKEPTFVNGVANSLLRPGVLRGDELRQVVDTARSSWLWTCKSGPISLIVNDVTYGPEVVLDLYLNGHYFHADEEKRTKLDGVPSVLSRHQLNTLLVEGVEYVVGLRWVIATGRSQGGLSI